MRANRQCARLLPLVLVLVRHHETIPDFTLLTTYIDRVPQVAKAHNLGDPHQCFTLLHLWSLQGQASVTYALTVLTVLTRIDHPLHEF